MVLLNILIVSKDSAGKKNSREPKNPEKAGVFPPRDAPVQIDRSKGSLPQSGVPVERLTLAAQWPLKSKAVRVALDILGEELPAECLPFRTVHESLRFSKSERFVERVIGSLGQEERCFVCGGLKV